MNNFIFLCKLWQIFRETKQLGYYLHFHREECHPKLMLGNMNKNLMSMENQDSWIKFKCFWLELQRKQILATICTRSLNHVIPSSNSTYHLRWIAVKLKQLNALELSTPYIICQLKEELGTMKKYIFKKLRLSPV